MPDDPGQPTLGKHGGRRTKGQQGDTISANVTLRSRGNSVAYIIARLRREGLHERVEAIRNGEISAFACACLLGWRQRPATVHGENHNKARRRRFDAAALIG